MLSEGHDYAQGSLMPLRISQKFIGSAVQNPSTMPICIIHQYLQPQSVFEQQKHQGFIDTHVHVVILSLYPNMPT